MQVHMDIAHHRTLAELHGKVDPADSIVGWFSTGSGVSSGDCLIEGYYQQFKTAEKPTILLMVDTSIKGGDFAVKAFTARRVELTVPQGSDVMDMGFEFQEVECKVASSQGLAILTQQNAAAEGGSSSADTGPADATSLQYSFAQLEGLLEKISAYVDAVERGAQPGDREVGRKLSAALAQMPRCTPEEFQRMAADGAQDVLLASYVSNLVRAHISLSEKLGASSLPIY